MELHGQDAMEAFLYALMHDADGTRRAGFLQVPWRAAGSEGMVAAHASLDEPVDAIALRCAARAWSSDMWVGVQLLRHIPPRPAGTVQRRGGKADTAGLAAVAIDIDFVAPGRAAKTKLPLPPDEAAGRQILAGLPDATVVVRSGAGLQGWWVLDRHAALDVAEAERISQGWGLYAAGVAERLGWHLDKASDLARVLRLPGTVNHKYVGLPRVSIVATGRRYTLGEISGLVPAVEPVKRRRAPDAVRVAAGEGGAKDVTDRWSAATPWADLLGPAGWRSHHDSGHGDEYWVRPGKTTAGWSAVAHQHSITVFSDGDGDLPGGVYSKLSVLARLRFGGDESAAWRSFAPPLEDRPVDPDRLAVFVVSGDPAKMVERLIWAARQVVGARKDPEPLVAAAAAAGMAAARARDSVAYGAWLGGVPLELAG